MTKPAIKLVTTSMTAINIASLKANNKKRQISQTASLGFVMRIVTNLAYLPVDIVLEFVVAAKHDDTPKGHTEREEHLASGRHPHLENNKQHQSSTTRLRTFIKPHNWFAYTIGFWNCHKINDEICQNAYLLVQDHEKMVSP